MSNGGNDEQVRGAAVALPLDAAGVRREANELTLGVRVLEPDDYAHLSDLTDPARLRPTRRWAEGSTTSPHLACVMAPALSWAAMVAGRRLGAHSSTARYRNGRRNMPARWWVFCARSVMSLRPGLSLPLRSTSHSKV